MDLNILISSTSLPIILRVQFHNWFYFVCKIIYDLLVFRFLCVITANLLFLCIFWFIYTHFFVRSSWYFLWIYVIFLFLWNTNTTNTTAITSILLLEIPFLAPFADNYNTMIFIFRYNLWQIKYLTIIHWSAIRKQLWCTVSPHSTNFSLTILNKIYYSNIRFLIPFYDCWQRKPICIVDL